MILGSEVFLKDFNRILIGILRFFVIESLEIAICRHELAAVFRKQMSL